MRLTERQRMGSMIGTVMFSAGLAAAMHKFGLPSAATGVSFIGGMVYGIIITVPGKSSPTPLKKEGV